MHKKGFTLIEIIVCIILITLIGTVSIISINKKENNIENNLVNNVSKELQNVTNKIIEATNVYISVEKDSDGNIYSNGINSGGKGLQITVNNLYETGYIDEKIIKTLEDKTRKDKKDLYVFVSNSIKTESDEECKTNGHSYTVSWATSQEPIYLCPFNIEGNKKQTLYSKILKQFETEGKTNCTIPSSEDQGLCFTKHEESTNNKPIYWYLGSGNNYVDIKGKQYNIVRTTDNNNVILLSRDTIDNSNFQFEVTSLDKANNKIIYDINGNYISSELPDASNGLKNKISNFKLEKFNIFIRGIYDLHIKYVSVNSNAEPDYTQKTCDTEYCNYERVYANYAYTQCWGDTSICQEFYDNIFKNIKITNRDYLVDNALKNWFDSLNINEKYVDNAYNWCNFGNYIHKEVSASIGMYAGSIYNEFNLPNFKCDNNFEKKGSYSILTNGDYYIISKIMGTDMYLYNNKIVDSVWKNNTSYSELTFINGNYFNISNYFNGEGGGVGYSTTPETIKIRPAIVIKGDVIVNSGTGTSADPFVLNIN